MSIFDDVKAIEDLKGYGEAEKAEGHRLVERGQRYIDDHSRLRSAVETGAMELADAASEARMSVGDVEPAAPDPEEPKAYRKRRSDAGRPRGPRSGTSAKDPIQSTLTDELRGKLLQTLATSPKTLDEIAQFSWAAGLSVDRIEGLMCEDPAAFVYWTRGPLGVGHGSVVWGTWEQFDAVVQCLTIPGVEKANRHMYTAKVLGCTPKAALDAWKRIDPE